MEGSKSGEKYKIDENGATKLKISMKVLLVSLMTNLKLDFKYMPDVNRDITGEPSFSGGRNRGSFSILPTLLPTA